VKSNGFSESEQFIIELQSEILGVLSNPKRLMILKVLGNSEKSVGEIAAQLGIELQNTSQHLRIMKSHNIVRTRREGQAIYYHLTNPIFAECCELVHEALMENLENIRNIIHKVR